MGVKVEVEKEVDTEVEVRMEVEVQVGGRMWRFLHSEVGGRRIWRVRRRRRRRATIKVSQGGRRSSCIEVSENSAQGLR